MIKQEILNNIALSFEKAKEKKARNSMGVSEMWYNPYYLIGNCFTTDELLAMPETELTNLVKLANYASDCFY